MEQQTKTMAKGSLKELLIEHFNAPMLMLMIYSLANFRSILGSITRIVNTLMRSPLQIVSAVLNALITCFPLVLLVLMWLHRFEKVKKPDFWMGSLSLIAAVLTGYVRCGAFIYFFANLPTNMYELISVSPFLSILNYLLTILAYLFLGIILLQGKKGGVMFTMVYIIAIVTTLFFGILTQMTGDGSLISAFITAMLFIALFNIPKVILEPKSKEVGKSGGLTALAVIVLIVYLVSGSATGTLGGGSGSYSSPSSNTCKSCGRSWNAGDSGKNFMNIAKTGMCNNCENNFHSLEDFLD